MLDEFMSKILENENEEIIIYVLLLGFFNVIRVSVFGSSVFFDGRSQVRRIRPIPSAVRFYDRQAL